MQAPQHASPQMHPASSKAGGLQAATAGQFTLASKPDHRPRAFGRGKLLSDAAAASSAARLESPRFAGKGVYSHDQVRWQANQ